MSSVTTLLLLSVPDAAADCLADDQFNQFFVDLNDGGGGAANPIPLEGSCCQHDVCGLPCPEATPTPHLGTHICTVVVHSTEVAVAPITSHPLLHLLTSLFLIDVHVPRSTYYYYYYCRIRPGRVRDGGPFLHRGRHDVFLGQGQGRKLLCGGPLLAHVARGRHAGIPVGGFQCPARQCRLVVQVSILGWSW